METPGSLGVGAEPAPVVDVQSVDEQRGKLTVEQQLTAVTAQLDTAVIQRDAAVTGLTRAIAAIQERQNRFAVNGTTYVAEKRMDDDHANELIALLQQHIDEASA